MVSIVIYDHRCSFCATFIRAVKRMDRSKRFSFLPFESKKGKSLLTAQFGKVAFTMYIFARTKVYWGPGAAKFIVRSLGFPKTMSKFAAKMYPSVVKSVSTLTHRKREVVYPRKGFSMMMKSSARKLMK